MFKWEIHGTGCFYAYKKKKKKKKKSKNVKKREEESGEICWKAKQTAHVRDCSDATGGCCGSIRLTSDRLK